MANQLPNGLLFDSLHTREGLVHIDAQFLASLEGDLRDRLISARNCGCGDSALILELAPYLEDFVAQLFDISPQVQDLQQAHHKLAPLHTVKRQFIQRVALKRYPAGCARPEFDFVDELTFATQIQAWMADEGANAPNLDAAARYAAWASLTEEGQAIHHHGVLFNHPQKVNPDALLPKTIHQRLRDGFSLTDPGFTREQALDQATYCILCHHQGRDSCSKGLKPKIETEDRFQKNTFGAPLTGCPLEQKISEMNEAKGQGYCIGALAIICIDNPMVAATGHRICNDCMKACIFQKQDPVNIPGAESQILRDVLDLPWGFEIYSLLTRWNPLNFDRPFPREKTSYEVLVVGAGPAGFTLAHHLLNEGHSVAMIDGLKIEPLPTDLYTQPIRDVRAIEEDLDDRIAGGFGGVAEYGITVRWDKNYLKIIRLLLERRSDLSLFGGVRFGGTLTIDQAFSMGFDHIALCMGAGSPTLIPMKNSLAPGVRQASDFLMALQLTGAAKKNSRANLQMRLPVVVIGGGLTAIDTATEAMAYYPRQVEKFYRLYREGTVSWTAVEQPIVDEFVTHGQAVVAEREAAEGEGRQPNFAALVRQWGGVHVVYRKKLNQAPAYKLNHEEVAKALEEGIQIVEEATPQEVLVDQFEQAEGLRVTRPEGEETLPARSILIAAGTKPNTNLRYDDPEYVILDGRYFQAFDEAGQPVPPERLPKPQQPQIVMHHQADGRSISFFGDLHPSFAGNVVKAMASAKQGYPIVNRLLSKAPPRAHHPSLILNDGLCATVHAVNRLTPTIVEVVVKAPFAARAFRPGQFYRLQNFETISGTAGAMEGIAVTGASVDREAGLLSTIILEMGGSSSLCRNLKPGEPIVLMGPTGSPTEIPHNETVLLVGGGLGNAVLFSIGQAMRAQGCRVIYYAGYKQLQDRYKVHEIEAAADRVVWCCDEAPGFNSTRPQDLSYVGNLVQALRDIPLPEAIDRLMVIGSDSLMAAVALECRDRFDPRVVQLGSINSPMQCMMKEICAQCLQRHVDPKTGEETIVYSCANQDQDLKAVDFKCLSDRLSQNSVLEKLTILQSTAE